MKRARIFSTTELKVNITSSIDVSQDESYFAAVTRLRSNSSSMFDYQISTFGLKDLKARNTTYIYSSYNENTHPCKIMPSGKTIIVVTQTHIYFYNSTLSLKNKILHNQIDVYDLQISPNQRLLSIIGNQKILIWDTQTYKQILFPSVNLLTKKCKFSYDGLYFGVTSQASLVLYRITQVGDTYRFDLDQTTDSLNQDDRLEMLRFGSFNTFQFNPYNSLEIVVGFGNTSPRIYSFDTRSFRKVAVEEQPFQMDNFKVVRFMPDGRRVISGDSLKGVGYWPGAPDKNLVYKENYLLFGLIPYDGGRKIIGYVWERIKIAEIQFECTPGQFSTSCECPTNFYWDMSSQICKPCNNGQKNICQCGPNQTFNPDLVGCFFDCSKFPKAIPNLYKYNQDRPCYCERGYTWKNGKCEFDCKQIFFTQGPGKIPESCQCNTGFVWNPIGKYCECPRNSRLVTNIDDIVECACLYRYTFDPQTKQCKPNCDKIRYTNGTDSNGDCQCVDGYVFQIYQNQSAIASQEEFTSKSVLSANSAACVRNCSLINNTQGIKFFDQCQCDQNMVWDIDRCKLNCRKIRNAVQLVKNENGRQSCSCTLNYNWIQYNRQCARNCDGVAFVNHSQYPTTLSCPCRNNFNWNGEPLNKCVIDCQKINFTQSYSLTSSSECICRRLFIWDQKQLMCKVNCSQIWDGFERTTVNQCSCKNNRKFNKTSMTCMIQESAGVFSQPWVWAILGVFLLFVLVVVIVMLRFCWKFTQEKKNKEHQKKLKKNTAPKLKKKDKDKEKDAILSSERAQLNKQ